MFMLKNGYNSTNSLFKIVQGKAKIGATICLFYQRIRETEINSTQEKKDIYLLLGGREVGGPSLSSRSR